MTYVLPADPARKLRSLAEDRVSGAREIVGRLLNVVADLLREPGPVEDLLVSAATAVVPHQPTMAALLSGMDRLFSAAARGGHEAVRAEVERQLLDHPRDLLRIAEVAEPVLRPLRSVALLSWSSTIAEILDRSGGHLASVVVAESRPGAEGRRAAQRAAAAGRRVLFVADAAFPVEAAAADALLLGGDALGPRGLINKVGSRAAAREVRAAGKPVFACLEDQKIVGGALADRLRVLDEPAAQLWEFPPAGVEIRNRYFESTPLDLLTAIVTTVGVESPADAIDRAGPAAPNPLWSRVAAPVVGAIPW